jgi:pimeloyl-ACP methyl ester carboxylesterase
LYPAIVNYAQNDERGAAAMPSRIDAMRTELISIATETTPLDGAMHRPDESAGSGGPGVLMFHGNTMNFYTGALRFLPPALTPIGLACLAFNRRGHDILSIRDSFRAEEGGALQLTRESIEDNALAAQWMAAQGYPAPIVIGHSNGGMLGVKHVVDHPHTPALVLLSAQPGGDSVMVGQRKRGILAGNDIEAVRAKAEALVAAGRGKELMLVPGWWYVISAESYLDRLTTMPHILDLAPQIKCPVLYIRGDGEPAEAAPAEEFRERAGGKVDVAIVPNCDHFYRGCEAEINRIVSTWLADHFC